MPSSMMGDVVRFVPVVIVGRADDGEVSWSDSDEEDEVGGSPASRSEAWSDARLVVRREGPKRWPPPSPKSEGFLTLEMADRLRMDPGAGKFKGESPSVFGG